MDQTCRRRLLPKNTAYAIRTRLCSRNTVSCTSPRSRWGNKTTPGGPQQHTRKTVSQNKPRRLPKGLFSSASSHTCAAPEPLIMPHPNQYKKKHTRVQKYTHFGCPRLVVNSPPGLLFLLLVPVAFQRCPKGARGVIFHQI